MENIDFATMCACFNIRKAARAVTSRYDAVLRGTGVRATQATLLMAVATAGAPTITQLADTLIMDRTTLARDLGPLAEHGLLSVTPGEDRRTRIVQLTEAGHAKLDEIIPLWQEAQAQIVCRGLGNERWRTLYDALQEVVQLAQK